MLSQNNYQSPLDLKKGLVLLEPLLPFLEEERYQSIPLIRVYYHAFLFFRHPKEILYFNQFEQSLSTYQDQLPLAQVKALQTFIRIYCIQQINTDNNQYLAKAFKLYQEHLELGYLYYDGGILQSTIRNMVNIALKLQHYNWVHQFLEKYKDRIVDSRYPKNVYNFNLALYYFALQSYEEALECLTHGYEDVYYKLAAKRLELKIYYEQNSVLLDSKMEAFKIYLHRNSKKTLTNFQRKANNNFINMFLQLTHSKTLHNRTRINKLLQKISANNQIAEKYWLIAKLKILNK